MAKTAASRKAKGSRAERKVAEELRRSGLDPNAGRMPLSGADSHLKGDVRTDLPYVFEVKAQERVSLWQWWRQAEEQAHYHPPVLCITANHRPMLAVVRLETLMSLLQCEQQLERAVVEHDVHDTAPSTRQSRSKYKRKVSGEVVER